MRKLKIIYKPIKDVLPYAKNANKHSQAQIDKIIASIEEYGMATPIGLHKKTIVYGHGRIEALKQMGEKKVPTVDLSDLTKKQMRGYVLADNRIQQDSEIDIEILKLELSELDDLNFDLNLTGYDDDELKLYLGNIDEDGFPVLADGEKEPYQQKTFTLHDTQAAVVEKALEKAKTFKNYDRGENENSNGNALFFICKQWLKNVS